MMIASWNVNSVRVRKEQALDWLETRGPDVLGLQELKCRDEDFPAAEFQELGYFCLAHGQPTYNGVALLTRRPASHAVRGIPGLDDPQARAVAATVGDTRVVNLYVPNGKEVGHEHYRYKLRWLEALADWLREELRSWPRLAVIGDFNIAPDDRDVHDPEEWRGKILCSEPERTRFQALEALGLRDSFRLFKQPEGSFSWWDYRAAGFRRNRGLRIDLILLSEALASECRASRIDTAPRKLDRPSDHAPVLVRLG
ncbi:exodeoxyribonuclease III [Candidatus Foliamicus sp.]